MPSGLSKLTTPVEGFPHLIKDLFAADMKVYVAKGEFTEGDIPVDETELSALYDGETKKFLPFGMLDGGTSDIKWETNSYKTDFHDVPINYTVTGNLISLTLTGEMLGFIEEAGIDQFSFLFVPVDRSDVFLALSGVSVKSEGSIPVIADNEASKITFTLTRKVNKLRTALKFELFDQGES